ncbi:hypothetical protein A3H09_01755 [Candidatus Falkowbacteria bacterium RIFCSPLOWO2_12_FULL_45_13]|uniref:Uncharacterized protein n=2 Tax=Candidatus Falkowiibacteriota TaxID=1752728 RepID=A0A1F5SAT3_9BACT|nr:MAG: hypothetical protein A3H66_03505 [Candidatus Falkowbacteria bacterium RIFCSPLOWO2_02_FULL_45_21]OGF30654.1 MAG: hypothetical protein A3H09_01755 [Candidatus Falkowbacteria bacterium RIFCSPLOWO2_12_FULL_45_13]
MLKRHKTAIIVILVLIIAAGGFWYMKNNNSEDNDKEKIFFATGFTLFDNETELVWTETVQLSEEDRAQFAKRAAEIKVDLAKQAGKDDRLADYNNLAIYQNYLGNYRESYDAYLESLKLESQNRVVWQNFADVLLKIKAYKSAEFAYKKAVELNKYIPESYVKLANYYRTVSDDEKTEATYKLAIQSIKDSSESDTLVLNDYADWLVDKKRYDEAIKILEELIIKQPGNKEAIEREIEQLRNKK